MDEYFHIHLNLNIHTFSTGYGLSTWTGTLTISFTSYGTYASIAFSEKEHLSFIL